VSAFLVEDFFFVLLSFFVLSVDFLVVEDFLVVDVLADFSGIVVVAVSVLLLVQAPRRAAANRAVNE
jgi:hypothetical protein